MSIDQIILFSVPVLIVWLLALSILFLSLSKKWNRFTENGRHITLAEVLETLIKKQELSQEAVKGLIANLEELKYWQRKHFQKFALVRYNPFEDTGGDQSFVIALLDGENSGVVISSLHSRNGTRVYAKGVSGAKSQAHEFSKEEKEVVEKAALSATAEIKKS